VTGFSDQKRFLSALLADPRNYQISVLSTLILLGLFHYGFHLPWWHVVGCVGATLTTQAVADRIIKRPFDPRSPLISALSLTLLLRTGSVTLSIAAGVIAIASKYLIRWRGKHIFNPANFGLVILSLFFTAAWIFFMISDPKTTPDSRLGRVIYAGLVALVGFFIQFGLYNAAGIILALILCAPIVPLIDRLLPSGRYHWPTQLSLFPSSKTGDSHETLTAAE